MTQLTVSAECCRFKTFTNTLTSQFVCTLEKKILSIFSARRVVRGEDEEGDVCLREVFFFSKKYYWTAEV